MGYLRYSKYWDCAFKSRRGDRQAGDILSLENWKDVPGWEGLYEVSDFGRLRSLPRQVVRSNGYPFTVRGKVLSLNPDSSGHYQARLMDFPRKEIVRVHRIVLLAFVGEPAPGEEGCHNDGDKSNNRLSNLRWDTRSSNQFDRVSHGTHYFAKRTTCSQGHEYTDETVYYKPGTPRTRNCRICRKGRK